MSDYFRVSVSPGELGIIEKWIGYYDLQGNPNSYMKMHNFKLIDYPIEFPVFKMKNKSARTDQVSSIVRMDIFSKKFKQVLEEFQLPSHQFFNIKIAHRKEQLNSYFAFHMPANQDQIVDYKNCVFEIYNVVENDPRETKFFTVNSLNDYLKKLKIVLSIGGRIKASKVQIFKNFDLFRLGPPMQGGGLFCSKRLKGKIEELDLTGFGFVKVDKSFKEIPK